MGSNSKKNWVTSRAKDGGKCIVFIKKSTLADSGFSTTILIPMRDLRCVASALVIPLMAGLLANCSLRRAVISGSTAPCGRSFIHARNSASPPWPAVASGRSCRLGKSQAGVELLDAAPVSHLGLVGWEDSPHPAGGMYWRYAPVLYVLQSSKFPRLA